MTRVQAFASGLCIVVLALGPGVARAQTGGAESSPEACQDRVDNDGDGYVDCYDADCRAHPFCQQAAPAPAPEAVPAPPPYPPPPGYGQPTYYAPPQHPVFVPPPRPPSTGVGELVVGSIFLPVGALLIGTSFILWEDASFSTPSSFRYANAWGAVFMDIFGAAFLTMGAIFIPVGIVKMAKYSRWKREQATQQPPAAGLFHLKGGVALTPTLSASNQSGSLGFKLTF